MLEQKTATPAQLVDLLIVLVESADVSAKMRSALAHWHAPKAAENIAEMILKAIAETSERRPPARRIATEEKIEPGRRPALQSQT